MLRHFCDLCGMECKSDSSGSRAFDDLESVSPGKYVGLNITPTVCGRVDQNNNICDMCLGALFVAALNSIPNVKASKHFKAVSAKTEDLDRQQAELRTRFGVVSKREKEAEEKITVAEQLVASKDAELASAANTVAVLQAQLRALTQQLQAVTKQTKAQEIQLEIDKREDPGYVERVQRRERIRAS